MAENNSPTRRPRAQRVARRRDVRAVPGRSRLGQRELAGLLRRLPTRQRRRGQCARQVAAGQRPHRRHRPGRGGQGRIAPARGRRADPAPAAKTDEGRPKAHRHLRRRHRRGARRAAAWRGRTDRRRTWRPASGVPTATSFREVPAKLLEVNRRIINGYLGRTRGGKVSFTHLIGYAIVRAVADTVPEHEQLLRRGPRRQAPRRAPRHVGPGPGGRRREDGRLAHPAGAGHQGRRHARLPRVLGRLRGHHPQGPLQQAHARRLRRRHASPSPTPAPSARSSRCPASCPARA